MGVTDASIGSAAGRWTAGGTYRRPGIRHGHIRDRRAAAHCYAAGLPPKWSAGDVHRPEGPDRDSG